ncbi:MAG: ribulose-phosphate 3-epimerase [Actinobacteria bacterium]|nr:ribulose-phosphate 3-epimerase [Actinomycetota bacterium]
MHIHPSILSADFANLESELGTILNADAYHVDVMDNHFVPNLTFGPQMVESLQRVSKRDLDIHLMITDADIHAPGYAELGVASVTFHIEASKDPIQLSRKLKSIGAKAAAAVKPATSVNELAELMPELDMILIMTVEPGFGGQKLIESTIAKVSQARELARAKGLEVAIQVDGGVTEENIATLARAGADTFVAGSSVFRAVDRNRKIDLLRTLAQEAGRG